MDQNKEPQPIKSLSVKSNKTKIIVHKRQPRIPNNSNKGFKLPRTKSNKK